MRSTTSQKCFTKAFISVLASKVLVSAVAVVGIDVLAAAGGKLMIDGDDSPPA